MEIDASGRDILDAFFNILLGFTLGCGYDVELTQMVDSAGNTPWVFGVDVPALRNRKAKVTLQEVLAVFADPQGDYLRRALADLREAIRSPKDTAFFCYRAIESLRQFFVYERGAKDKVTSWELLRSELGLDRSDLDPVAESAKGIRHGDAAFFTGSERERTLVAAWEVTEKFIMYARHGYARIGTQQTATTGEAGADGSSRETL